MAEQLLDTVVTWKNPDNSVRVSYLLKSAVKPGQTEDQFVDAEIAKLQSLPDFVGLTPTKRLQADLPDATNKRKWRELPNGKINVDNSVETPKEAEARRKTSIRAKLKAGTPLTDDELDLLVGK